MTPTTFSTPTLLPAAQGFQRVAAPDHRSKPCALVTSPKQHADGDPENLLRPFDDNECSPCRNAVWDPQLREQHDLRGVLDAEARRNEEHQYAQERSDAVQRQRLAEAYRDAQAVEDDHRFDPLAQPFEREGHDGPQPGADGRVEMA